MPGPAKVTGAKLNARVAVGSALERILAGRPVTETLHVMAELIEAAPSGVMASLPAVTMPRPTSRDRGWSTPGSYEREPEPVHVGVDPGAPGGDRGAVGVQEADGRFRLATPKEEQEFFEIGHDPRSRETVSRAQVLALAREQYPAGLVPVIDEGDEFDVEPVVHNQSVTGDEPEVQDDDDLEYLR